MNKQKFNKEWYDVEAISLSKFSGRNIITNFQLEAKNFNNAKKLADIEIGNNYKVTKVIPMVRNIK